MKPGDLRKTETEKFVFSFFEAAEPAFTEITGVFVLLERHLVGSWFIWMILCNVGIRWMREIDIVSLTHPF